MGLGTALDLLVARIEGYTPTVDPQVRFRRADVLPSGAYRIFVINPGLTIEPNVDSRPNPYTTDVTIEVYYDRRTERYEQLKRVISDAEELFNRVMYSNSDQWGQANNIVVRYRSLAVDEIERRYVIMLTISMTYNV